MIIYLFSPCLKTYKPIGNITSFINQGEKKMKIPQITTIMVILLIALIPLSINTQPAKADINQPSPGPMPSGANPNVTIATIPFLSVTPNPVGVGQTILVNVWLHPPINVNRQFIQAFTVTITKPDGTQATVGPLDSFAGDSTGWFPYIADQVGTWKFKFNFLGMWFPAGRYYFGQIVTNSSGQVMDSAYYKPSETKEVSITVQTDQVASWPPAPLPTDYWTRPVNPNNREWWTILGYWPNTGIVGGDSTWPAKTNIYMANYNFIPYSQAPNSAHIVWRRQNDIGGLIGGTAGQVSTTMAGLTGNGYPTIVLFGRCYEVIPKVNQTTNAATQNYWRCYDLRTGEIYWERMVLSGETIPTIVEYAAQGAEVPGATAREGKTIYLVAITAATSSANGRIVKYNPYTGAVSLNLTGVPPGISTGTLYAYPNLYSIQTIGSGANVQYRLIKWNMENNAGLWQFAGGGGQVTVDNFTSNDRIKSNISWPFSSLGTCDFETGVSVTAQSISSNGTGVSIAQRIIGVNLNTGAVMWNVTTDPTSGVETFFTSGTAVADHGKYAAKMQSGEVWAWDLMTGNIVWKSPLSAWPWGVFGAYHVQSAYGLLFENDYDGVQAINWTTGKIEWSFKAPAVPFETPYNDQYSWHSSGVVADGKLYTFACEHTPSQPLTRGWKLYCINATTGANIWNVTCGQGLAGSRYIMGAIEDGYLAYTDEYQMYLNVYGKGKSATTISAPLTAITQGQSVVLTGTVFDKSPAQPGTACIADEYMGVWMDYLHSQQPKPINATGVQVSLDAMDPNGNQIHIATVTSDMSGTYSYMWKPDNPGKYTVTATFMGSNSYGSSYAETAVGVVEAPQATVAPATATPLTMPPYEMYTVGTGVAVIIAILIVGILILRKRP
jgi:hypothetical protein